MLNSSLIGRVLPTGYPCGGTITIVSVEVHDGWKDGLPTISCGLKWDTGNPILDANISVGSLAPGTMLWDALSAAGPVYRATHRLQGVPVHGLAPATSPWDNDTADWSRATRIDNGEDVIAPTYFFVTVD